MARSNVEYGPYLIRRWGGTAYNPPTSQFESTTRSLVRKSDNGTVKRVRPKDLLANLTSYYVSDVTDVRTLVNLEYGNAAPISDFVGTSPSLASVQQQYLDAERQAASRLRAKIADMTWNAAVSGAEMGKTLSFLITTSKHLLHAYRLAKKGDVLGLSELYRQYDQLGSRRLPAYKRVANVWLQWRYAVRPAVQDLSDAMHELARSNVYPTLVRASGRGSSKFYDVLERDRMYQGFPIFRARTGSVSVCYVMYFERSTSASFARLGLTNLPALLWELTPYSFVVDNFVPIGTYLAGLGATVGITAKGGFMTRSDDWRDFATYRGGLSESTVRSYSRSLQASIPNQPLPGLKAPTGDLPSKALDAIALLSQVYRRKR